MLFFFLEAAGETEKLWKPLSKVLCSKTCVEDNRVNEKNRTAKADLYTE